MGERLAAAGLRKGNGGTGRAASRPWRPCAADDRTVRRQPTLLQAFGACIALGDMVASLSIWERAKRVDLLVLRPSRIPAHVDMLRGAVRAEPVRAPFP